MKNAANATCWKGTTFAAHTSNDSCACARTFTKCADGFYRNLALPVIVGIPAAPEGAS